MARISRRAAGRFIAIGLLVLGVYVSSEVLFRVVRYRELGVLPVSVLRVLGAPIVPLDADIGFRFVPGTTARHLVVQRSRACWSC